MAAIDKIYGSRADWLALKLWLQDNNPLIDRMGPQPEEHGMIANFSLDQDIWLWEYCPLDFVKERLKTQYGDRTPEEAFREREEVRNDTIYDLKDKIKELELLVSLYKTRLES